MKKIISIFLSLALITAIIQPLNTFAATASTMANDFSVDISTTDAVSFPDRNKTDTVKLFSSYQQYVLFLPGSTDLENTVFNFATESNGATTVTVYDGNQNMGTITSGVKTNILKDLYNSYLTFTFNNSVSLNVYVFLGSKIPSMHISLEAGSFTSILNDPTHETAKPAKMMLINPDGTINYNNALSSMKGRGNATWGYPKRGFNIKLDKKTDLLGMGVSKGWCLIANWIDPSNINNRLAHDTALDAGMAFTSNVKPVDLYVDGEYLGLYNLTEKVDIEESHVNITNLEKATEEANGVDDLEVYPSEPANQDYSIGHYKYYNIPKNPADITGGYLLEWELKGRYKNEKAGFVTNRGQAVVIKEPEYPSKEQVEYIMEYVNDMEEAVYSETGKNSKGKHYSDYIDEESFAKMLAHQETFYNLDTAITSFFVYKDSETSTLTGDSKLHASPIWDFDNSLGVPSNNDGSRRDMFDKSANFQDPTQMWASLGVILDVKDDFGKSVPHILAALNSYHPDFANRAKRAWHVDICPNINNFIFGGASSKYVKTFSQYYNEIRDSAFNNEILWGRGDEFDYQINRRQNFIATRAAYMANNWKVNFDGATIEPIPGQSYTGKAIKPKVVVKQFGKTLIEGTEYSVAYENTTNIGYNTAKVRVIGKGYYVGEISANFSILNNVDPNKIIISEVSDKIYTGQEIKPQVILSYEGKNLIENLDYTVTYQNNINAGIASININGIAPHSFKFTKKFTIEPKVINPTIYNISNKILTGSKATQTPLVVYGNRILFNGIDYSLSYKNNTKPGKANIIIKGIGNNSFTKTISFIITPKTPLITKHNISKGKVNISLKVTKGTSGTEVFVSTRKDFDTANLYTTKTTSKVLKLSRKKTYYIKARSYVVIDKKRVYSDYCTVKKIKTK